MTVLPQRRNRVHSGAARLVVVGLVVAVTGTGCAALTGNTGAAELDQFLTALSQGDVAGAAALTTDPAAATEAITASITGLTGPTADPPTITAAALGEKRRPDKEPVRTETTWEVGAGQVVTTSGQATTTKVDGEWKVDFAPAVLDSRLEPGGQLTYSELLDWNTAVLDRTGALLMSPIPVSSAQPAASDGTGGIAAGSTTGDLVQADSSLRSPGLSELQGAWREALREVGGWSVELVNPGVAPISLGGAPAGDVADLVSTYQISIQQAAQRAVNSTSLAASIVAIQPSTGGVLAVAQNSAADQQGPVSLQGQFPPGSTFKTVTTAAALEAGVVGAEDVVPCPASITVSGRTIPNDSNFALGTVPLETAFARSCNTSQAVISDRLSPDAMTVTAAKLGLGVDFVIPGLTTITGSVPITEQGPARVEAAIGQGQVLASPFGMAVLEASLAAGGRMILPSVISGMPAVADQSPEPLRSDVVSTLRRFMEQTVRSGTATAASSIPGLGGKTGTAEVATGPAHGWFVGSTGDIALAVLIEGANSSGPAVSMAAGFLAEAGQPAPLVVR